MSYQKHENIKFAFFLLIMILFVLGSILMYPYFSSPFNNIIVIVAVMGLIATALFYFR